LNGRTHQGQVKTDAFASSAPHSHAPALASAHGPQAALLSLQQAAGNAAVSNLLAGGAPLPPALRRDMERRFGCDFGEVRIHDGPGAEAATNGLSAKAITIGSHIAFDAGRFAPDTSDGRRLIAHELAHVVQQSRGGSASPSLDGTGPLEGDAARAGRAAVGGAGPISVAGNSAVGPAADPDRDEDIAKLASEVQQKAPVLAELASEAKATFLPALQGAREMGGSLTAEQKPKAAETSSDKPMLEGSTPASRRQGEGGVEDILTLQRTAGNQGVGSFLQQLEQAGRPRSLTESLFKENLDDDALALEIKAARKWLKANPSDPQTTYLRSELDDLELEQSRREEEMRPHVERWNKYQEMLAHTWEVESRYNDYNSYDHKMKAIGDWDRYLSKEELRYFLDRNPSMRERYYEWREYEKKWLPVHEKTKSDPWLHFEQGTPEDPLQAGDVGGVYAMNMRASKLRAAQEQAYYRDVLQKMEGVREGGALATAGRAIGGIAGWWAGRDWLAWSETGATIGGWGDVALGAWAGQVARGRAYTEGGVSSGPPVRPEPPAYVAPKPNVEPMPEPDPLNQPAPVPGPPTQQKPPTQPTGVAPPAPAPVSEPDVAKGEPPGSRPAPAAKPPSKETGKEEAKARQQVAARPKGKGKGAERGDEPDVAKGEPPQQKRPPARVYSLKSASTVAEWISKRAESRGAAYWIKGAKPQFDASQKGYHVYEYLDENGQLLYAGRSGSITAVENVEPGEKEREVDSWTDRLQAEHINAAWIGDARFVRVTYNLTHSEMLALEEVLIPTAKGEQANIKKGEYSERYGDPPVAAASAVKNNPQAVFGIEVHPVRRSR
jgi:hypothetical protein